MIINPIIEMPLELASKRINALLGQAVLDPTTLTGEEVREIACSVLFHLLARKPETGLVLGVSRATRRDVERAGVPTLQLA